MFFCVDHGREKASEEEEEDLTAFSPYRGERGKQNAVAEEGGVAGENIFIQIWEICIIYFVFSRRFCCA